MVHTVKELLEMFENFIYTMGLLPLVQGVFVFFAILAMVEAIRELRGK